MNTHSFITVLYRFLIETLISKICCGEYAAFYQGFRLMNDVFKRGLIYYEVIVI